MKFLLPLYLEHPALPFSVAIKPCDRKECTQRWSLWSGGGPLRIQREDSLSVFLREGCELLVNSSVRTQYSATSVFCGGGFVLPTKKKKSKAFRLLDTVHLTAAFSWHVAFDGILRGANPLAIRFLRSSWTVNDDLKVNTAYVSEVDYTAYRSMIVELQSFCPQPFKRDG